MIELIQEMIYASNSNNTGQFLKSLRISKGLTQMELAEYLNFSNKTVS